MIKLANKIALASLLEGDEWMEKKALNLASLLRMSRNAAKKGKLSRFSELLDKRNLAIDNVAYIRSNAAKRQKALANIELDLYGYGPANEAYQSLLDRRYVNDNGDPASIKRIIKFRDEAYPIDTPVIARQLHLGAAGPWTLKDLAAYSKKQNPSNIIDKPTYPSDYPF